MPSSFGLGSLMGRRGVFIIMFLIVVGGAIWFAYKSGFDAGYGKAEADAESVRDESARRAAEEAAKSANPFQAVNPLSGIEANPFEKTKKILNPFEN